MILIGPEGGWPREEEEFILDNGFKAVSLGKNILRTETAAISALALISHFWNL
jgi:16S rRNA (uracil1498-N3)-methyltransferase